VSPANNLLVVHDYFGMCGGGERLVLVLSGALGASLMFGYRSSESYQESMFPRTPINLALPTLLQRPTVRAAALAIRFTAARSRAATYGTRVFSGVAAPFAAPDCGHAGRNILYCHTPPRFLYDQREYFFPETGTAIARLNGFALERFRRGYETMVARMHVVVANSMTVRERISRYLGRESVIIYPPCDTASFSWIGQQGYYLSTARLASLKRVDRIVDAFLTMPDRQLVVISGGEEEISLRCRARDAPNITFLGWVDEGRLRRLIGEAIATIYVPVEEDFGMSPVESMAAGKPVIAVAEGGLRETVLDGETGILLEPTFTTEDIRSAVRTLRPSKAASMRSACETRAQAFSQDRFIAAMRAISQQ
jgi:glycosyltransferase involved in cell wall biosynthesis